MKQLYLKLLPAVLAAALLPPTASAQKKYDTGASDSEIVIGNTTPYSGPASAYQEIGKAINAYFQMVNDAGGINGRKVRFISLDDGYNPPKTVEQTRKLVEQEKVLFMAGNLGTGPQIAVQKYLNANKVPQLFVYSGGTRFSDPKHYPWSMGFPPSYEVEGRAVGRYIVSAKPAAKIAVIVPSDDAGKDYLKGFKEGVATGKQAKIVAEATYATTDASVDSQLTSFKTSGADAFFNEGTPKFAAQGIVKAHEMGWKPLMVLPSVSSSVAHVLQPAGLDKSVGTVSPAFLKDPSDKSWDNDKGMQKWRAWMAKYDPSASPTDLLAVSGYSIAELTVEVLRRCGDNLTRENVMKVASSLEGLQLSMQLPGLQVNTSPSDYRVNSKLYFQKFDGATWKVFGEPVGG